MNILICNPPYDVPIIREGRCQSPQDMRKTSIPQMTLAYMAGVLGRSGHALAVLDCIADDIDIQGLFERMDTFKPDLAFFNTTTPSIGGDMDVVRRFKERYPDCFCAVFGTHVTILHKQIMEDHPALDSVIRHEPEWTALALASGLESGGLPPTGLPNCTLRLAGNTVEGPCRPMESDLDSLGCPAWEHFSRDKYLHPVFNRPYLTVNTSRGCAHNCIFCVGHIFYGKKMRYRSVQSICDELERDVLGRFKTDLVWFYADDFTASPEFVKQLCREIIRRKIRITWWTNTRVDRPDREMFRLMRAAGCYMLSIGGESGNAGILKTIRKGTKPEFIRATVTLLREEGIISLVYFLIGLPGESPDTIRETVGFAKSINPDYVEFYPATPYPGTAFHDIALEQGLIADTDWAAYMCGGNRFVVRIPGMENMDLDRLLRSAYREFYFRPVYIKITIRRMIKNPAELLRLTLFGLGYMRRFLARG